LWHFSWWIYPWQTVWALNGEAVILINLLFGFLSFSPSLLKVNVRSESAKTAYVERGKGLQAIKKKGCASKSQRGLQCCDATPTQILRVVVQMPFATYSSEPSDFSC
jgi:hypothetical protein